MKYDPPFTMSYFQITAQYIQRILSIFFSTWCYHVEKNGKGSLEINLEFRSVEIALENFL